MNFELTKSNKFFAMLLFCWFLINALQAYFTEILGDEAYYFLYSKYLDWGYYDHPPMVALIIRFSSVFFDGNLGVRFLTIMLQVFTLIIIWNTLENSKNHSSKSVILFFIISFSMVMFNAYGFVTTPDVPLLFFTALLLFAYKNFLKCNSWGFSILIAISMSALIYSKYQAALVILFIVLSNFSILRNPKFQIAVLAALALTFPHFYWQFKSDFPSLKYHLVGRSESFNWNYVLEFVPNQLVAFNPLVLVVVFYVIIKFKPSDTFEKSLYFLIVGIILFFGLSTIRGHVQAQRTVAASIPMIILLNNNILNIKWLSSYIYKYVGSSLILIFIARIVLLTDLIPPNFEFNGKKSYYKTIEKVSQNKPVIFAGSYRYPALYTFFTGKKSIAVSNTIRGNLQFGVWNFEKDFFNQTVFVVGKIDGKTKKYYVDNETVEGYFVDNIQITDRLKINYVLEKPVLVQKNDLKIKCTIENTSQFDVDFKNINFPIQIHLILLGSKDEIFDINGLAKNEFPIIKTHEKIENEYTYSVSNLPKGKYRLALGCSSTFGTTLNSEFNKIEIIE